VDGVVPQTISKSGPAIDLDQIWRLLGGAKVFVDWSLDRSTGGIDSPTYMRVRRTILAALLALSLAMLPMARAFVAPGNEAMASEIVAASAHDSSEHEAMASDVVVVLAHECCDPDSMPADHAMNACPASAGCTAKCFNCYAVVFSGVAIPSPIGGKEAGLVSNPFYSRTASPPFRPPRT
jgi:hypothetical protein